MIRRVLPLLAAAVLTVPALSGCILISTENPEPDRTPPAPTATSLPRTLPSLPNRPAGDSATIGDPCELLTRAEVMALTKRRVTQIDPDGASETAAARFCQWQLDDGQVAIFVSHSTKAEFAATAKNGTAVNGLGDGAFTDSGHLYVLSTAGGVQIDVYVRGGVDETVNLKVAKATAEKVLPRLV